MPVVVINTKYAAKDGERYSNFFKENGFDVRVPEDTRFGFGQASEQEVLDLLEGASAVFASSTPYTASILGQLPELRVIARTGVGFETIDINAATANNIVVTITPKSNHESVSEHAMALILGMAKSLVAIDKNTRLGNWPNYYATKPMRNTVLGIVGLGRIGRDLAMRARAMRMQIIAAELFPDKAFVEQYEIELVDTNTLFKRADYISLHCPLTDETRGIINKETLSLMKPEVSIINTARGGLVVEADLVEALKSGRISGAGLDVFEQEPTLPDNPLYELENVILSPHIAGSDYQSREDMGFEAAASIIDLSEGRWPDGSVVNHELKEQWSW